MTTAWVILVSGGGSAAEPAQEEARTPPGKSQDAMPLLYSTDFEGGADAWKPTDQAAWEVRDTAEGKVYALTKRSSYKPPHRSPLSISVLKEVAVSDFILEVRVRSADWKQGGHTDMCVFFGHQDPAHFYYVHLGKVTDKVSNHIHLVNDAPRQPITKHSPAENPGTPWDDRWHTVKIVRRAGAGTIEVYFDDMDKAAMTVVDKTLTWGRVGLGSFDNTVQWDDLKLWGERTKEQDPGT